MSAKELRAAAEWLHKIRLACSNHTCTLIDHILATVREDDDEPMTFEWCRSVTGGPSWDNAFVEFGCGFIMNFKNEFPWFDTSSHLPITAIKTRGEFRALCRCLGVTLKEGI